MSNVTEGGIVRMVQEWIGTGDGMNRWLDGWLIWMGEWVKGV